MTTEEKQARIAKIDANFDNANSWGSWMVMAANEREMLANELGVPHKYLARTSSGGKVS